jgi:signal transduction histidine kinase
MSNLLKTLWREPRVPNAFGPVWRDWALAAAVILLAAAEGFFSQDLVWRPLTAGLAVAIAFTLPWRRTHPVPMIVIAFGAIGVVQTSAMLHDVDWRGLYTTVFGLLLPYTLLRWGSGREAFVGLGFLAVNFATTSLVGNTPWTEILGASLFLLFPATLGASVRYRDSAQRRAKEHVRLRERERLARELHDTVAHHVSAIAIQAQAGRALVATRPEAPLEALEVIEEAASRALNEMRNIVRALRSDGQAHLTPTASVADIERLALDDTYPLQIDVTLSGELNNLDAALAATLFRLTQESVTNSVRHAEDAQSVTVLVTGDTDQVHLTVKDDGNYVAQQPPAGFGLQGMAERVALLGGSMRAGPGELRGWTVEATLPRRGAAS